MTKDKGVETVVKTFSTYGSFYDASKSQMFFSNQEEGASYKITVTMIDGEVQTNALVERL
jgi:hypothetical protein